jgi:hypothetical protein
LSPVSSTSQPVPELANDELSEDPVAAE